MSENYAHRGFQRSPRTRNAHPFHIMFTYVHSSPLRFRAANRSGSTHIMVGWFGLQGAAKSSEKFVVLPHEYISSPQSQQNLPSYVRRRGVLDPLGSWTYHQHFEALKTRIMVFTGSWMGFQWTKWNCPGFLNGFNEMTRDSDGMEMDFV